MTGKPLPANSAVSVSVLNGTGTFNQATTTANALSALGYHTVGLGDTAPVGDVAETYVFYGSRDAATEAAAESVVRSMSGAVIMAYNPAAVVDGAQVTVVTGSQFSVNAPQPTVSGSTTSTSQVATPTTVVPPSSAPAGALAAPTPASTNLQAWDPRACPSGATPVPPTPNPGT
jgi:hypothetical protein